MPPDRVRIVAAAAVALVAFAALYAIGWPASTYRHADFAGFWVGSRLVLDGADPYDPGLFLAAHERIGSLHYAINPPGIGYGYPLTAAIVFAPFAMVPLEVAAPLWLVVQVSLAVIAVVALARALQGATLRRDLPVLLAFGAASQPAWLLAVGGNLGGYLIAIAAGAAALLLQARPFLAGVVAGLSVVKPHPLLIAVALLLLALTRRDALRFAGGAALSGGAIALVSLAVRPGWIGEFLVSAGSIGGAPVRRATIFGLFGPDLAPLTWTVVALSIGALSLWILRTRPPLATVAATAVPSSLVLIPYAWSYDHLALLVTAAISISRVASVQASLRLGVLVSVALAMVALPWALYAIAFRRGDESLSALVPLAVLLAFVFAQRAGGAAAST